MWHSVHCTTGALRWICWSASSESGASVMTPSAAQRSIVWQNPSMFLASGVPHHTTSSAWRILAAMRMPRTISA